MVLDQFASLLEELSKAMDLPKLAPDANNSCLIEFKDKNLEVQIEPLDTGGFLLILIDLGNIPPGRYREEVFQQALIANGLPSPRHGTFCYSDQSDHLLLYKLLPLHELNGEKIASFLPGFMEKGRKWKESMQNNEVPLADTMRVGGAPSGSNRLFGL